MMIEKLGAKNLKSRGRMMIEKVMIQLGPKKYNHQFLCGKASCTSEDSITGKLIPVKRQPKNLKSSCRMMIEKVMIQLGVYFNRKGGGGGHAGSQGQKPTGKAEQKASGTGNAGCEREEL